MLVGTLEKPSAPGAAEQERDVLLARRFLAGDQRAFEELVAFYQARVYNICLRMLGNAADAEDVAQDVFVGVHQGLARFGMRCKLSTWIYRITANRCISYRRKLGREVPLPDDLAGSCSGYDEIETRRQVRRLLQQLPNHYRVVLVMKYYRELSYAEIAEILGWSLGKVRSYLHRARRAFERLYESEMGGEES